MVYSNVGQVPVLPVRTSNIMATVNQHPPADHPLDAFYYSVVDEPQLS